MNKIFGYFLSVLGLAMVFFAIMAMFKVFVDKQPPIALISNLKMNVNTQYGPMGMDSGAFIPILNMAMHAMFMFFLASCGGRIANIGVNFVKIDAISEAIKETPISEIKKL